MTHHKLGKAIKQYLQTHRPEVIAENPRILAVPESKLAAEFLKHAKGQMRDQSVAYHQLTHLQECDYQGEGFWARTRQETRRIHVETDVVKAELIYQTEAMMLALEQGLTIPMLEKIHEVELSMEFETHKNNEAIRVELARRDLGLDASQRLRLRGHDDSESLSVYIEGLIDERDREPHPEKKELKTLRISQLKEELRARGEQAVGQAGGRLRLGQGDQDADSAGSSESSSETDSDAVPFKNSGSGK